MNATTDSLRFGGARLEQARRVVADATGRETVLRAKSYDVLALLLSRPDTVVTKDELFERVWNGVAVTEDALVQCITDIRKAIGEKGHEALKTITKVGYRLVPDANPSVPTTQVETFAQTIHPRGIAVLPFSNISDDKAQDFLAVGLTEDVITDLSSIPDLFVIARNSSYSFGDKNLDTLGIARDLGVRYLVEGSVRKSGERLRITVKLIDAQTSGSQIWAERYDRNYADVFDIQDDIAQQVAKSIVGKLASATTHPRQRPLNMEVFELSQRARDMRTKSRAECKEAISILNHAIALDPNYSRIRTQIAAAHTYNWVQWMEPGDDDMVEALKHAAKAIELDVRDTVARATHGFVLLHAKRWEEALAALDMAVAMNPNGAHAYALKAYLSAMSGDGNAGLDFMNHAMKLNPHPPNWYYFQVGLCFLISRQFAECIKLLRKPQFARSPMRRTLIAALELDGQHEEAVKEAALYVSYDPTFRVKTWLDRLPYRDEAMKQYHLGALARAGIPE
jgi:adenylate cyclase